jgi:predicted lipid-binding transport protein (Tim44 family)
VISLGVRRAAQPPRAPAPDRWRPYAEAGTALAEGLDSIAAVEPQFDPTAFLNGARAAYEMTVGAFAAGDLNALRRLTAPEVYANFAAAIEARRTAGEKASTTIVSIDNVEFVEVRVIGRNASIAVRFASKLISSTVDSGGAVVEGSATAVGDHLDIWTFARALGLRDPNWLLTATETVH